MEGLTKYAGVMTRWSSRTKSIAEPANHHLIHRFDYCAARKQGCVPGLFGNDTVAAVEGLNQHVVGTFQRLYLLTQTLYEIKVMDFQNVCDLSKLRAFSQFKVSARHELVRGGKNAILPVYKDGQSVGVLWLLVSLSDPGSQNVFGGEIGVLLTPIVCDDEGARGTLVKLAFIVDRNCVENRF